MYNLQYLPDGFKLPCLDYKAWEIDDAAISAMNDDAIAKSIAASQAWPDHHPFGACYVIGLPGVDKCKIGFSTNPSKRLKQLSTGLWDHPKFHALFWSHASNARCIEFRALALAKKLGVRLRGEWVDLSALSSTILVLEAIWGETHFTDSANFMEQWEPSALCRPEISMRRASVSVGNFYDWAAAERG